MQDKRLVWLVSAAVFLLAGISLGQYLQRMDQHALMTELKAEILDELRQPRGHDQKELPGNLSGNDSLKDIDDIPPEPVEPLSSIQYWISNDYSDEKPFGFSAWLELVPDGNIILEKCAAPDYHNVQVTGETMIEKMPECEQLINTKLATLNDAEMKLKGGHVLPMKLEQDNEPNRLVLTMQDQTLVLVPGSKNTLWTRLSNLPSVRMAYQKLWDKHLRMRNETENSGIGRQ